MKRLMAPLLITVLAGACEGPAVAPDGATIAQSQDLDIAEATFRYQFGHNASGEPPGAAPAYFLTLFRKNPSPEFIKRFKDHKPPVSRGSEFVVGKGLVFSVDRIITGLQDEG